MDTVVLGDVAFRMTWSCDPKNRDRGRLIEYADVVTVHEQAIHPLAQASRSCLAEMRIEPAKGSRRKRVVDGLLRSWRALPWSLTLSTLVLHW